MTHSAKLFPSTADADQPHKASARWFQPVISPPTVIETKASSIDSRTRTISRSRRWTWNSASLRRRPLKAIVTPTASSNKIKISALRNTVFRSRFKPAKATLWRTDATTAQWGPVIGAYAETWAGPRLPPATAGANVIRPVRPSSAACTRGSRSSEISPCAPPAVSDVPEASVTVSVIPCARPTWRANVVMALSPYSTPRIATF